MWLRTEIFETSAALHPEPAVQRVPIVIITSVLAREDGDVSASVNGRGTPPEVNFHKSR